MFPGSMIYSAKISCEWEWRAQYLAEIAIRRQQSNACTVYILCEYYEHRGDKNVTKLKRRFPLNRCHPDLQQQHVHDSRTVDSKFDISDYVRQSSSQVRVL